jgi:microcystin degradation protein MlrC
MRIAVGGIHTECSTYSPLTQTEADFAVSEGVALADDLGLAPPHGAVLVPLFHARSLPGGPVAADTYARLKADFLARLAATAPLDGVLLVMHGAMHVHGLDDAEGDWIAAVRAAIGPGLPMAVSYDLHGNVTQPIVDAIDIFAAYRTAPHIDVAQTHNRALAMLADTLATGTRRVTAWAPIPLLLPGERTSTEDEPTRSLYAALPEFDARPGVSDANLMIGYVWADTPRATAAAVVTGTDRSAASAAAAEIAQGYWENRAAFRFGATTDSLERCLELAETATTAPVILADSGDNPTGGGVGDRADVLDALVARHVTGAIVAGIADAPSARAAAAAAEGPCLEVILAIGGSLGSDCPTVVGNALVERVEGPPGDLQAVVSVGGNQVVLTERRRPFHRLADFHRLGLAPETAPLVVVKSGYLSPALAPLANPALMALTDGAVNQDIVSLGNRHRQRPIWPFQTGFAWSPQPRLSARATA